MHANKCELALKLEAYYTSRSKHDVFVKKSSLPYHKSKVHAQQKIWKEKYKRGNPITMNIFADPFSVFIITL